jgi:hypothetical protein
MANYSKKNFEWLATAVAMQTVLLAPWIGCGIERGLKGFD